MPYLQLDVNDSYPEDLKQQLAARMCETYASMMSVDIRRISVAIRESGAGAIWRIAEVGKVPVPVSLLMLDIRRGRPAELRMAVAKALCAHCIELLGLREDRLNVEFTQHDGDEMYHPALEAGRNLRPTAAQWTGTGRPQPLFRRKAETFNRASCQRDR